jgi:4-amino-4-deoxy-L-arabinose transferase-like glycosyltransferase
MKFVAQLFSKIYNNDKKLIFFIFFLAIFSSLFFLFFLKNIGPTGHQVPNTDYLVRYEPIANSILEGRGITLDGQVHPEWAPGFSVILAGLFTISNFTGIARLDLIVILNIILSAASACLLFLSAKELFGKKIGFISSFLWLTYPFNLWFLKNPNSEVPFLTFLYFGILFLVISLKKNNLKLIFLTGFMFGLASLIRLPALFFSVFLAGFLLFILKKFSLRRRVIFVLILLLGNFFAFLPWGVYSSVNKSGSVPVSDLSSEGLLVGYTFLLGSDNGGEKIALSPETREALEELKINTAEGGNSLAVLAGAFKKHPAIYFHLTLLRIVRAWYATGMMWWEQKILLVQSFYILSAVLGLIFAVKKHKDKITGVFLILGIIIYFWAMSSLTIPILRYLIPAMPLVIVLSAIFLDFLLDKFNVYGKICFDNHSL